MTQVGGRTVTIGRSTDIENNNGYELELDVNANQLIIRDQNSGNEITADVGQGFIQDVIRANSELRLPTYADNANAVQEDAQIWFNDGSGADAAGIYHYDGGVVGPLETGAGSAPANLSGLTIDIDKDWGGYVITGAGHDEVQLPQVRNLTVADFEGGVVPQGAAGAVGDASVQNSVILEGNYSLEISNDTGNTSVVSFRGLQTYPELGDTGSFKVYFTDAGDGCRVQLLSQKLLGTIFNKTAIAVELRPDDEAFQLKDSVGGDANNIDSDSVTLSNYLNEVLTVNYELGKDREVFFELVDSGGNTLSSLSATVRSGVPSTGLIGVNSFNTEVSSVTQYFDGFTVERREPEAAANTQKGVTEVGNELTPSGGVQTGPQEAPLNALRQTYAEAPVDDGATQGDVSYLTLLQSGLDPAAYVERILDGSGGAYGHQLQTALGRFSRLSANLSWEYETLADVPNWASADNGNSTYTFNMNSRPRRLHVDHDGSASSDGYGGFSSSVLTTLQSLGAFRVEFLDVSFTANGNSSQIQIGVTDTSPDANFLASGNGLIFDGTGPSFTTVSGGGTNKDTNLNAIDWSSNHDIGIEYDGSEARAFVDGSLVSALSFSTNADFVPAFQLEDDAAEGSGGDTLEVGQVTVEPLPEVLH